MLPRVNTDTQDQIIKDPDAKPDFSEMFKSSFIDIKEAIPRQPVAISIGETDYKGVSYPIPFATYGNYSCIVAPSKSKKSFFKSAIIAAYIGGESLQYFPNIRGHRSENTVIVDIDTEQSRYDCQRVFRRSMDMVGYSYDYYFPFSIRGYSEKEAFEFVDWLFNEWENREHIGLMSIDGYSDLINNFNDVEQSTKLTRKLLKWTDQSQCHITGILHSNFGSDKPMGHIGSSILRRAETVVYLTKSDGENDIVKVDADKYSRNKSFESFEFFVNDDWLPEAVQTENQIVF